MGQVEHLVAGLALLYGLPVLAYILICASRLIFERQP